MRLIEEKVANILLNNVQNKGLTAEQLLESDFRTLNINSLNFIKIIVALEEEFDIEFDDNQINFELFGKVSNIVSLIEELQQ